MRRVLAVLVIAFLVVVNEVAVSTAHANPIAGVPCIEVGPEGGPLIVALHHQGGSPEDTAARIAARLPHARVIAPAAEPKHGHYSWYSGSSAAPQNESVRAAVRRLERVIAALPADRPVLVTGYSQGAIMALALAIESPRRIARVIAVSGRIPTSMLSISPATADRPSILLLHGRADATISFASGERSAKTLAKLGFPVELIPYSADGHGLSAAREGGWLTHLADATKTKPEPGPTRR